MGIISLTTDFGLTDNFVGVLKAVILKINPSASIVDISHQVKPQDISGAAFLLNNSFSYFPKGTVHLVVVDPGVGSPRRKIIARTKDYYFVGPDNGVLTLALKSQLPLELIEITNQRYFLKPTAHTFHGRDIFAPVAARISKGERISKFGKRIKSLQGLDIPSVKIASRILLGEVIHIDHFGNLISNIDENLLNNFIQNNKFRIYIKGKAIGQISFSYSQGSSLRPVALINSFGYLEIAVNSGSACRYLKAGKGTKIKITRT